MTAAQIYGEWARPWTISDGNTQVRTVDRGMIEIQTLGHMIRVYREDARTIYRALEMIFTDAARSE